MTTESAKAGERTERGTTDAPRKRVSIAELWDGFLRTAIPVNAPAEQLTEMRKAFYSGCWSLLWIAMNTGLDDGDEATAADLAYLGRLDAELNAFVAEMTS